MAQGYEFSEKVAKACQKKEALFAKVKHVMHYVQCLQELF